MSTPDPHDLIRQAARQLHEAREALTTANTNMRDAINQATSLGLTYAAIGEIMDLSRQRVSIIAKGDKP